MSNFSLLPIELHGTKKCSTDQNSLNCSTVAVLLTIQIDRFLLSQQTMITYNLIELTDSKEYAQVKYKGESNIPTIGKHTQIQICLLQCKQSFCDLLK